MHFKRFNNFSILNLSVLCVVIAYLSGCATFSPLERNSEDLVLPDEFKLFEAISSAPDRWWEGFESSTLNALVEESISGNFTLRQALARMDQAIAVAQQNRSALFPELGYSTDAGLSSVHRLNTLSSGTVDSESYALGVSATYEVDLWNRLRSNRRASDLDAVAIQENLYTVMQSVVSQVAVTWFDVLEIEQLLDVTREQLETNQTTLELMNLRFSKGLATSLDVLQQRQVVARTEAILPPLEAQYDVLKHALAIFMGKAPRSPLALGDKQFPVLGPLPDVGIPADLLARRPDVRAAGLRLQSADWRVGAARANRLPALRINSGFSFNGDNIDVVFDNWMASLTGSLTGPIFDAGRRRAEVDRTRAVVDERLNAYRQIVLVAVTEVENALVRIDHQQTYIEALSRQYKATTQTHTEALNRYRKGLNDYLPVLTALTIAQNLEREVIGSKHDLLVFRVQLHLALGGDWMNTEDLKTSEEQ